ncbi:sigma-70 family RNA polymerase sigma factor [bacterium]|nr:sigma-70 family RNA polymerase sigma factor [bacterium]
MASSKEITEILRHWSDGDRAALDELIPLVYDELRRKAGFYLRRQRSNHTLQPTALVNEVYLRMARQSHIVLQNRAHFFAVAARIMRQILVNHAEAHNAAKRGGTAYRVTFNDAITPGKHKDLDVTAVDLALKKLAAMDVRKSRIIELHFFAGLTSEEIAEVLEVSLSTVKRESKLAKAWLYSELKK